MRIPAVYAEQVADRPSTERAQFTYDRLGQSTARSPAACVSSDLQRVDLAEESRQQSSPRTHAGTHEPDNPPAIDRD